MAGFGWLRNIQRAVASRAAGVVVGVVGITTAAIRANPMRDLIARADEAPKESVPEDQNSLEELAKEMENQDAAKLVKPPVSHDDFEGSFMSTNVDTFEGLRMAVQKQVNLNTAVSHFYWIGSSQIPPYYHYRLILQDQVNGAHCWVQTQDFANLNGNLGVKINESVEVTSDFGMNEKGNTYTATFNFKDIVNRTHVALQNGFDPSFAGAMFSAAFMQSVSKNLSFGGQSLYIAHQGVLVNSFGGMYDDGENCLSVQHGGTQTKFRAAYRRIVNPNRVTLSTGLTVDQEDNATVVVCAEYGFKQSTLKMSIDSGLMLKSTLVGQPSPGMQFTLSAEMQQAKEHYKFGYAVMMG